jgi:hypothetical protein
MFQIEGKDQKMSIRDKEEMEFPWGGKLVYYSCIVGGSIDARFMPAILKGIMEKMETGPLTGSYARDIRVYVYDGKMHPVDSNEISFRLAGRNAFSIAFKKAAPKILEPVYQVDVLMPGDRMGDVMSDLQGRRAIVQGMSSEMGFRKSLPGSAGRNEQVLHCTKLPYRGSGHVFHEIPRIRAGSRQYPGRIAESLRSGGEGRIIRVIRISTIRMRYISGSLPGRSGCPNRIPYRFFLSWPWYHWGCISSAPFQRHFSRY